MDYNIFSKCDKNLLMFHNPFFLQGFLIHSNYTKKERSIIFNVRLINLFWGAF